MSRLGHRVMLIPPQYVKPFVRRGKNDRNDAGAIAEAACRPSIPSVPVKAEEQQAASMLLKVRDLLVSQRTRLANAIRGHAAEFGLVTGQGLARIAALRAMVAASAIPEAAREAIELLAMEVEHLDERLAAIGQRLKERHRADPLSQRLAAVPGVGPVIALSFATRIDPGAFRSGRHLAAWLGLTPKDRSTGGKQRLGGISKAGDERLRSLLVNGAMAVIKGVRPRDARVGGKGVSGWLADLLERKPRKLAAVALANKMARILWAMMARGEAYRPAAAA